MEISPEQKAQMEAQKAQCIHCKLIPGEQPGAKTVYSDSKVVSMIDIYPAVKGHLAYMLTEHYPMPAYIPGDEFIHMFALISPLAKAIKKGMVRTGFNVFVAVGGVAGQMSPHFLVHLLPREKGDGFSTFEFRGKGDRMAKEQTTMLSNNLPIMMKNHFGRHPASWHSGSGVAAAHLDDISGDVVYQDEKVLVVAPTLCENKAHLIVYSKEEKSNVENLSQDSCAHFWFAASFASTAIFEGLGCHATNMVLKSGVSDDNPSGRLALHVFGRWQDDGFKINWQAEQTQDNLDPVQKQIKDEMWAVKFDLSSKSGSKGSSGVKAASSIGTVKIGSKKKGSLGKKKKSGGSLSDLASRIAPKNPSDEIHRAIEKMRE